MEKQKRLNLIAILILVGMAALLGVFSFTGGSDEADSGDVDSNQALTGQKLVVKRDANLQVEGELPTVRVGDSFQMESDARTAVTFEVEDTDIASVDEDGVVHCQQIGQTKLIITAEGNGTYEEEVVEIPLDVRGFAQKITGCEKSYDMDKDTDLQLTPEAKTKIAYKSKNPEIATVDKNGLVHSVDGGTAVIYVVAKSDGTYDRAVKKVEINVSKYTIAERNKMAIEAAIEWAKEIAADDTFHYGKSKWAHHHGCYFCGTNQAKGSEKRKAGGGLKEVEKTYCCNPFVTAAFCHGAGAEEIDCKVGAKRINLANDRNRALKNTDAWQRISKPSSVEQLEPGDVLLTPTHAMLYAGDGKVLEAAHHDNGKKDAYWNDSIRYAPLKAKQWKRVSKIYRYLGTGKF